MSRETDWTTKRVRAVLVEAVTWARQYAGPIGPAAIRGSMPVYKPTLEDHLEEGWGLPEVAGDETEEERPMRVPVDPARADFLMAALSWQAVYLVNAGHPGLAKTLSLWLHHATGKRGGKGFDTMLKQRRISRSHAYRIRDRALGLIAQGLIADGVRDE
ncbi:hypothetical protein [Paracoccus aerius]|uniref:Uncharacterized protein n=2 Tax=Paracoccus aerius TaxID=1915382 RepID=A0ABS1S6B0_9RHOB|nr:hypothetical protein [Paracoccus aerius]MBL3674254.1 hypothetical protein [Paracoccus aerius]GHG24402.1 hypothetical protein GCM10017322_22930 [Paracoccus aerius]